MSLNKIDVTIIIVTFNSSQIIENCIKSIIDKTYNLNYQIVVVDNKSNDNTIEIIQNNFSDIKIIQNKENLGFGKANNQAILLFESKYYFLLNPDTELINNSITILYEFMEKNIDAACCGGNLYDENMNVQYSYGNFPTIQKVLFEFGLHKVFKEFYKKVLSDCVVYQEKELSEVPYITGADLMIRKNVLDEVGLFDNDFFLYYEETELQYRIRKKNYKIYLIPQAKIKHISNYSINQMNSIDRIKTVDSGRNLYYYKIYGKKISLIIKFLYIIRYFLFILIGKDGFKLKDIRKIL